MRVGLVLINKGVDEIEGAFALHQAEERMQAAEGIPQREDRIYRSFRLIDFQVVGTVTAIGIAIKVGGNHAVVEGGVEHRLVGLVVVGHLVAFHLLVPFVVGFLLQGFEVEVVLGEFGFQVVLCSFHINGRNGDTHDNLLTFRSIKIKTCLQLIACSSIRNHLFTIVEERIILERLRELGIEIEILLVGPISGATETADSVLAFHLEFGFIHKLIVDTFNHIEEHVGIRSFRESAAHHAHAVASGEFHLSIIVVQKHSVVACLGILILMLEC